jgi:hypothetical protein
VTATYNATVIFGAMPDGGGQHRAHQGSGSQHPAQITGDLTSSPSGTNVGFSLFALQK